MGEAMQESLPQYQPLELSDLYSWQYRFAEYQNMIREVSKMLLDQDWRQIDDKFIQSVGSDLRNIIKEVENLKRNSKVNVSHLVIDELVQTLSNAIGKLYEFSDLKNAPDSQSKTSYYSKINECREHLSSAEELIQSILGDISSNISAEMSVGNNQASSVAREQIPEQSSQRSPSRRTRKKAGTEDQSPERQPSSANTEIESPIKKESGSTSAVKSSSLALLEEQEHNNISSSSLQDPPDQTGGNEVPLTRRDVESLLQTVLAPSDLKLNARNLRGIDLRDFNLAGADLANADLTGAILRSANLQEANLQGADMSLVNLRDADLQGATLQGASLREAMLQRAKLQGVDLSRANLYSANLHGGRLHKADLFGTSLVFAILQGADLQGADLREANLQGADLRDANLQETDLRDADLQRAKFEGANLEGVTIFQKDIFFGSVYLTDKQRAGLNLQEAEPDNRDPGSSEPNEALLKKPDTVSAVIDHRDQTEVDNVPHDNTLVEKTEDHENKAVSEPLLSGSDEYQSAPERSNEPLSFPSLSAPTPLTNDESETRSSTDQNQHQFNGNKDSEPRTVLLKDEVRHVANQTHHPEETGEESEIPGTRTAQSIGTDIVLSGEDVGADGILAQPLPIQNSDLVTLSIRELLWPSIVQSIERTQDDRDTQTLDIHITPSNSSREAEKKGEKLPGQDRRYEVVLQFMERKDGQLRSRSFEGPMPPQLLLDLEDKSLGSLYGEVLHDALFHDEVPENVDRVLRGEPGRQTLLTGFQRALARSEDSEGLRLQLRINTSAPEMHRHKWEYLWDPEGEGGGPLACSLHTPFARVLHVSSQGDRLPTITANTPIRILAALASPTNLDSDESILKLLQPGVSLAPIEPSEIEAFKEALSSITKLISPLEGDNLLASPTDYVSLDALLERMKKARRDGGRFMSYTSSVMD
jgi:uncharacterized protein YjbI with pentapeptide repeats